jgi:hypothetical protein
MTRALYALRIAQSDGPGIGWVRCGTRWRWLSIGAKSRDRKLRLMTWG